MSLYKKAKRSQNENVWIRFRQLNNNLKRKCNEARWKSWSEITAIVYSTPEPKYGPTVNSGLYDAMLQIAKSEKMVDRLQLAAFAGCKTKSVEEFYLFFFLFNLIRPNYIINQ